MTNYKITNLKSKAIYFFNEEQKDNFFKKNSIYNTDKKIYNYSIKKQTDKKEILKTFLLVLCLCTLFVGSILLHIQLNY
jgi:hypothetical protein